MCVCVCVNYFFFDLLLCFVFVLFLCVYFCCCFVFSYLVRTALLSIVLLVNLSFTSPFVVVAAVITVVYDWRERVSECAWHRNAFLVQ